ncbi:MAG: glutamine-hydrolyzing GMP synthase [Planctomycetota bacterium]|nr:glutamine-hydrolyzing GMP synthase [Planctomycetota bacterium]
MATPQASSPASAIKTGLAAGIPTDQVVPILDFGSQYVQLIARRVREAGVFSLLLPASTSYEELAALKPKGIILSGGPASVYEKGAPTCDKRLFDLGVPILGICYGMQIGSQLLGAQVRSAPAREYGRASLNIVDSKGLLAGVPEHTTVWMSHGDQVQDLPPDFKPLAATPTCPIAAVRHVSRPFYGVQFHPEVTHTPHGIDILSNFLFKICGCASSWRMSDFLETQVKSLRAQIGNSRVVCGLSGGVDSSVVAAVLAKAIGPQLACIFVDNGLLRKNERTLVDSTFRDHFKIDLRVVDASKEFLGDLAGIDDPQEKRKRIGKRFIDVFKQASADIPDAKFLAQGTLYPDVIESGHALCGGLSATAANIKLHHNVGGLPAELGFELVEPLRSLFKDEVRKLGEVLGLPDAMVWRHPFPGPGLAVRVLGPVSKERLDILRDADEILLEEIVANNLYRSTAQVFAVLLPVKAVGVMGDGRTYDNVIAVRAVESQDFMTADWARLPYDVLATISNRIINEVRVVNRVVYDISSKPPATIEWE